MNIYANIRLSPSGPAPRLNIAYLDTAKTLGHENIPIKDEGTLRRLIAAHDVAEISFHSTTYPQRPVDVDKAEKWIKKLGRELAKGRS